MADKKAKGRRLIGVDATEVSVCASGKNRRPVVLKSAAADDDSFLDLEDANDENSEVDEEADARVAAKMAAIGKPEPTPVEEVTEDEEAEPAEATVEGLEKIELEDEEDGDAEQEADSVEEIPVTGEAVDHERVVASIVNLGVSLEEAANGDAPVALAKAVSHMEFLATPEVVGILRDPSKFSAVRKSVVSAALTAALSASEKLEGDEVETAREVATQIRKGLCLEEVPAVTVKDRLAQIRKSLSSLGGTPAQKATSVRKSAPSSQSRTEKPVTPQTQEDEWDWDMDIND